MLDNAGSPNPRNWAYADHNHDESILDTDKNLAKSNNEIENYSSLEKAEQWQLKL